MWSQTRKAWTFITRQFTARAMMSSISRAIRWLIIPPLPTAGEPPQLLWSFHSGADLSRNPPNAIGASLHGQILDHVKYNDIGMIQDDGGLLTHDASFRNTFSIYESPPGLSLVDDFSIISKPYPYASSVVGEGQINNPALMSFEPVEGAPVASPPASLHPFSVSPPALPPQTPATEAPPPQRHVCATGNKTFGRAPDMQRHAMSHDPSARRIDCPSPGCPYTGGMGFLRSDKFTSHWQNRHQRYTHLSSAGPSGRGEMSRRDGMGARGGRQELRN